MSARPQVYNIPPGVAFIDALAQGLLARHGGDGLALARVTVLLPNRRACRSLREAFLRAGNRRAMLLPRMRPLGDLDPDELDFADTADGAGPAETAADLPPPIPELTRQMLLAQLIRRWEAEDGRPDLTKAAGDEQAARLAAELARLLDQVETEGLGFEGLANLVEGEHARHWQETLELLKIVTERWPAELAERGAIDAAARRRLLIEAQVEAWRNEPPKGPVIAAGSTGSIPATASLLRLVAVLPQGAVVLPGLDLEAPEGVWREIAGDPTHPQFGLARLLDSMELPRADVQPWEADAAVSSPPARARLANLALRPAAAADGWQTLEDSEDREKLALGLRGVIRLVAGNEQEEALSIALMLRDALETPGRTAALVTPDRSLARRVAAELARWGLQVDDSAGVPLDNTPPGGFLRLLAEAAAERFAPVPLLAALKHPLASGGQRRSDFRRRVRQLENAVLRGPRPAPGLAGVTEALRAGIADRRNKSASGALLTWFTKLAKVLEPLDRLGAESGRRWPLLDVLHLHLETAEALAATDETPGPLRLWAEDAGEQGARFFAELQEAAAAPRPAGWQVRPLDYPSLLTTLMSDRPVRPQHGGHARLAVLGPLEARLQHADLVVLGGLNEGTWPADVDPGPWLNRPMRADFGLPAPERRIGLAAHDFAQLFCASEIVLSRSERVDGAPTVESRWLLRLEALAKALGIAEEFVPNPDWPAWAGMLDAPAGLESEPPPAPAPPLDARPRKLPVTAIETWMRDPYAIYARYILGLRKLDELDQDPGAADLGILIHRALESFVRDHPTDLPADAEARLLACGREAFAQIAARPGVHAFWWPRFERAAAWVLEQERQRRSGLAKVLAEVTGVIALDGPAGPFELTAKADRIEVDRDGGLAIIDYKTGQPPSKKAMERGFAPQLPLEAVIAAQGGFPGVPAAMAGELAFWQLSGRREPGEIKSRGPGELYAEDARQGLLSLIARFDDPQTPYMPEPRPEHAPRFSDYAQLARRGEWSSGGGEGE